MKIHATTLMRCIPRTKVIHFANTTIKLTAMVRSVGLELATSRAIRRASILLADKDILGIEAL